MWTRCILPSRKVTVLLDNVLAGKSDVAFLDWGLSRDLLRYDQIYIGKLKIAFETGILRSLLTRGTV